MSIDTSTTAGKVAVMQAHERGESTQYFCKITGRWYPAETPTWSWRDTDYRIKPAPLEFTVAIPRDENDRHREPYILKRESVYDAGAYRTICMREVIE